MANAVTHNMEGHVEGVQATKAVNESKLYDVAIIILKLILSDDKILLLFI